MKDDFYFHIARASSGATFIAVGTVVATSVALSQTQVGVHPPGPEHAYHLPHDHHDLVGGWVPLGIGLGALYGTFKVAVHIRDIL